jgi:hypothetical protein
MNDYLWLDIDAALLSETHLKSHERFFIPNYHFHRTDRLTCTHISYVRYVQLTKAKPIHNGQTHLLVRERVNKNCDRKRSVVGRDP